MSENLVIALSVALLGVLPNLWRILEGRRSSKSNVHRIERLKAELDFLTILLTLSKDIADAVAQRASLVYAEYLEVKDGTRGHIPVLPGIFRRLFLLFQPVTKAGWVLHSIFYTLVLFSAALILSELVDPTFDPKENILMKDGITTIPGSEFEYVIYGVMIFFVPPLLVLRFFAVRSYKKVLAQSTT